MNLKSSFHWRAPEHSLISTTPSLSAVVILSLATFIVFFQGFMVAPILPELALLFKVSVRHISFIEPAYLLSYGFSTLIYAPLSDRYGRLRIIMISLSCFIVLTFCTGFSQSVNQMIILRLITGLSAGGVAPTTIGWISDRFPYERRGHALGIFFGFMAGGTALGSSAGALLTAFIGWQKLFWIVAATGVFIFIFIITYRSNFYQIKNNQPESFSNMLSGYGKLLRLPRGRRTYLFVLFNSMFHSGVFAWTGYLFFENYHLSAKGIGLALIGYGIPGLLLSSYIGKLADKYGRNKIIPIGIFTGALSAFLLGMHCGLIISCILIAFLSFGFDMTHPLFAAIITTLSLPKGVAIGLFAFVMFLGYGLGSLIFSLIMSAGLNESFKLFGSVAVAGCMLSVFAFKNER